MPGASSHFSDCRDAEVSNFENILAEISSAFVRVPASQISFEMERWLQRVVIALHIDRATIGQLEPCRRRSVRDPSMGASGNRPYTGGAERG